MRREDKLIFEGYVDHLLGSWAVNPDFYPGEENYIND